MLAEILNTYKTKIKAKMQRNPVSFLTAFLIDCHCKLYSAVNLYSTLERKMKDVAQALRYLQFRISHVYLNNFFVTN